jgi:hypothetical protein
MSRRVTTATIRTGGHDMPGSLNDPISVARWTRIAAWGAMLATIALAVWIMIFGFAEDRRTAPKGWEGFTFFIIAMVSFPIFAGAMLYIVGIVGLLEPRRWAAIYLLVISSLALMALTTVAIALVADQRYRGAAMFLLASAFTTVLIVQSIRAIISIHRNRFEIVRVLRAEPVKGPPPIPRQVVDALPVTGTEAPQSMDNDRAK